ncbi:RNA polymerase subunit sigma, partial [Staphylococcus warneri]
ANIMHLSISTIKKIKKVTQSKIMQHLQYNLEKE